MAPPEHQASDLSCPKCGSPRHPEALDCPFCGIVYERFDPSRQARAPHQATGVPAPSEGLGGPIALTGDSPWDDPAPGAGLPGEDDVYAADWEEAQAGQGAASAVPSARPDAARPGTRPSEPSPAPLRRHEQILARLEDLHIPILGALILIHLTIAGLFSTHMVSADQSIRRASASFRATTGKPLPQRFSNAAILGFVGRTLVVLSEPDGDVGVLVYTEGALAGSREPGELHADAHRLLHQIASEAGMDWKVTRRVAGWLHGEKVAVEQLEPNNEAVTGVVGYLAVARTDEGHPTCLLIAGAKDAAFELAREVLARD
jgi:hypothetical protein